MHISLHNKKALVGGSSKGLGKAIALQLAQSGAHVVLMARNEEKLQSILKKLDTTQGQIHQYLVVDFSDFGNYQKIISNFFKDNQVDILVNNTNGPSAGGVFEKNMEDYSTAFDLLFRTVCFTTLEALKGMKEKKYGRIINVSSTTVKEPKTNLILSNSIRSAWITWSKTLAGEVADQNITVNNILTGLFDTERLNEIYEVQAQEKGIDFTSLKEQMKKESPMKRFGRPEEFAYLTTFLASDFAAYITGVSIPIDGGALKSV
jgi:3-oxoacyl-[acyl-carrier protein] reductase